MSIFLGPYCFVPLERDAEFIDPDRCYDGHTSYMPPISGNHHHRIAIEVDIQFMLTAGASLSESQVHRWRTN